MPNIDFLKPALGDELFAQVSEKLQGAEGITLVNTADGSYVPKAKLDEERNTSKSYKTQIDEMNTQLAQLQEAASGNDALKGQIAQLQKDIADKDNAMKQQKLTYSIKDAVRGSKARNTDVVFRMIDQSKITENNGQIYGLTEQLDALKKSDPYLFESEADPNGGLDPHCDPDSGNRGKHFEANDMIRRAAGR